MKALPLQSRFMLAGFLLVLATVGSSVWSVITFARLYQAIDDSLVQNQMIVDWCTELHSALEREDDGLVLLLSGDQERGLRQQESERNRGEEVFAKLQASISERDQAILDSLRQKIDRYHQMRELLLAKKMPASDWGAYHIEIAPLLHDAVYGCDQLREANFRSMQAAGVRARDESARDTWIVGVICGLTVALGITVAVWLTRSVMDPIRQMTSAVEEIRKGNFDRRIHYTSTDELGELAFGFNRMAHSLAEYRRSKLGEVLAAKTTLEVTLNALRDAVFVFGPDGDLAAINTAGRLILEAKSRRDATHLKDLPFEETVLESVRIALMGKPTPSLNMNLKETISVVLNGQQRRFIITALPLAEFVPERFGAVVVLDEVTDFVRLDELRSELIGVASHELKSPLTTVQMNLMMLNEIAGDLPSRKRQFIHAAIDGCGELGRTIDELLDVTRIEAGQLRLHLTAVQLDVMIANVRKSLDARFEDANVKLIIKLPNEPIIVRGDPLRLQSVISNILGNALKYSRSGDSVIIEASSRQNTQANGTRTVQIAVTDQGSGVPEAFRERIFEKFFRVEHYLETPGKEVRGTGIGLYLCREIIKSHGGTIRCEAGPNGVGTRIAIILSQPA